MTIQGQEIYFILIFNMVVLSTSMSLSAALLSPLIYPPLLPVLGWLLQLERWLRMRSIWLWWRRQEAISFRLVVESFGVWTPFALSILYFIADRTTTRSGISRKMARRNLVQQLSVCLWTNNARMILRYWALQSDDNDFPSPCNCSLAVCSYSLLVVICFCTRKKTEL